MTTLYATITKADDQRLVYGIASTESLDQQGGVWDGQAYVGDVVDPGAIEGALPDYMEWGAVREMHQPIAAGTAIKAAVEDGKLLLTVRVVDDGAWAKVKAGVYKGFSIGGKVVKAVLEKLPDGSYVRRILKLLLTEISLVDRPANPDAKILVFKRAEGVQPHMANELIVSPTAGRQPSAPDVWDKLQQKLAAVQKAAADPQKIIAMIQQARNDCELGAIWKGHSSSPRPLPSSSRPMATPKRPTTRATLLMQRPLTTQPPLMSLRLMTPPVPMMTPMLR
jgi:HK97 family phage prohead protease